MPPDLCHAVNIVYQHQEAVMSAKWFYRGCLFTFFVTFIGVCVFATIGVGSVVGRMVS
jgi:hypothetical protein